MELHQQIPIHSGAHCNQCGVKTITGIRYKCATCEDYDLCSNCHPYKRHKSDHFFLMVTQPWFFDKGPLIPEMKPFNFGYHSKSNTATNTNNNEIVMENPMRQSKPFVYSSPTVFGQPTAPFNFSFLNNNKTEEPVVLCGEGHPSRPGHASFSF